MAFRRSRVRSPSAPPTSAFPQFVCRHAVERLEVTKGGLLHAGRKPLERCGSSPEPSSERSGLAPDLPSVRTRRWSDECSFRDVSVGGRRVQSRKLVESGSGIVTRRLCARGFTCAAVLGEDTDVVVMTVLVRNQSGEGIIEAQ